MSVEKKIKQTARGKIKPRGLGAGNRCKYLIPRISAAIRAVFLKEDFFHRNLRIRKPGGKEDML